MRAALLMFSLIATASAQSGIQVPRVGMLLDAQHQVQSVWGVAGNLIVNSQGIPPVSPSAPVTLASNGAYTLLKTATYISVLDSTGTEVDRWQSAGGGAITGFSESGKTMACYLPVTGETFLWRQTGGMLQLSNRETNAGIAALNTDDEGNVQAIVSQDRQLWLRTNNRQIRLNRVTLPAAFGPAGSILWYSGGLIHRRQAGGSEDTVAIPENEFTFTPLGRGWLLVESQKGDRWALASNRPTLLLYALPGDAQ